MFSSRSEVVIAEKLGAGANLENPDIIKIGGEYYLPVKPTGFHGQQGDLVVIIGGQVLTILPVMNPVDPGTIPYTPMTAEQEASGDAPPGWVPFLTFTITEPARGEGVGGGTSEPDEASDLSSSVTINVEPMELSGEDGHGSTQEPAPEA